MTEKIIAVIPARGGSKGILRKNVRMFCGKPLIAHIIKIARETKAIDRVIVSTEDDEILHVAKQFGAEVPFRRPEELAGDEVPTLPVLQHTVRYLEEQEKYQPTIICLLYPTSPLLKPMHVSAALQIMMESRKSAVLNRGKGYDSVISVVKDTGHYWVKNNDSIERLYPTVLANRQFVAPLYRENGAIYIVSRELLMENNLIVGGAVGFYLMQDHESVDIDTEEDFQFADYLMRKRTEKKEG